MLFAFAAPATASAQARLLSPEAAGIERALREGEQGYDIAERRYVLGEKLAEGGEKRHAFVLKAGATYVGLALCEEACGDVDLVVEDEAGNVVDNDEADGAEPSLLFRAKKAGRVEVVVNMKECGEDACEYGLGFHTLRGNPTHE